MAAESPPGSAGAPGNGPPQAPGQQPPEGENPDGTGAEEQAEGAGRPQDPWAARQDLRRHAPRTISVESSDFGGGLVGGNQHGVSGGYVAGDVIMGGKTEVYYQLGGSGPARLSGRIQQRTLDRLADTFVSDEKAFAALVSRLRKDPILVLSGPHFTGRRTAALMLLRRLGVSTVHGLDRESNPADLADQITEEAHGYVLCDLLTGRDRPLRDLHLLAVRERLAEKKAYLVITVGPTAALEEVPVVAWQPPGNAAALEAHVRARTDARTAQELMGISHVAEFLRRHHQLREVAAFARLLTRYALGEAGVEEVRGYSLGALELQVQEWFDQAAQVELRDKAFLVALAAFDGAPYALTAELADQLFEQLSRTENSFGATEIPVFGSSIRKRLQFARAGGMERKEETEWGEVSQFVAEFQDSRISLVVLREVWTGHPSARPALMEWLYRLADDRRALVRTRVAATAAVLAFRDLPSAMALIIEPWVLQKASRRRVSAVNALALGHFLGVVNIPGILDRWSTDEDERRRWAAIRAHALIGHERPVETLAALRSTARQVKGREEERLPDELTELGDAVELLLMSTARSVVLAESLRTLDDHPVVRDMTLLGFLGACGLSEPEGESDRLAVLTWYAQSFGTEDHDAAGIALLWRASLDDKSHTGKALERLADWIRVADRDQAAEWALAALLRDLVDSPAAHARLSHLLRTMRGHDGALRPVVTDHLLTALPVR